jgi:hypothetical protein
MYRCAHTGMPYEDFSDGIYDTEDGEFISWDWINEQIHQREMDEELEGEQEQSQPILAAPKHKEPKADLTRPDPMLKELFDTLVDVAQRHHDLTGRYLQIWGELGEMYAELQHGIERHKPGTPGSDGRLGNDFVEIKTISPEKGAHRVDVRLKGNFNKLLVVRISSDFKFESRMLDRKVFCKGKQKAQGIAKVAWQSMPEAKTREAGPNPHK